MKKLLYILALLPFISTVSLLISVICIFPITLFPNNILPVAPVWLAEFVLVILLSLYGLRLNKYIDKRTYRYIYWGIWVIILILFLKFRFMILLQSFVPTFYAILFDNKFKRFKKFLQKSINTIAFLNLFDTFFIAIFFILKNNTMYVEMVLNRFFDIFKGFHLSQEVIENTVLILMLLLFLILLPLLRSFGSVQVYKKQNKISVSSGKVLWNSYVEANFGSVLSFLMYISLFLKGGQFSIGTILIFFMFMSMSIYFWTLAYENINKGGDDKDLLISKYILFGFAILLIILLSIIESDLIEILTWFLPILLPNIIGNINKYSYPSKKPTKKMEKHLYSLTIMSFNLLFIYNILLILSKKFNIKERLNVIILHNLKDGSIFTINLFSTCILVLVSFIIALWINNKIIKRLEKYYLDPSKGYFD